MNFSKPSNGSYDNFILVKKQPHLAVFRGTPSEPLYFETRGLANAFAKDYPGYSVAEVGTQLADRALKASFGTESPRNRTGYNRKRLEAGVKSLGLCLYDVDRKAS